MDGKHTCKPEPVGRRSWIVSVAALSLASGLSVALAWMLAYVLHPHVLALAGGLVASCSLVPGLVIGLVDRRRPFITLALFAGGLLVLSLTAADGGLALLSVPAILLAVGGVLLGTSARRTRARLAIAVSGFVGALLLGFVIPEIVHRRDAARFAARRLGDVAAFVEEHLVALPDRELEWRSGPIGGFVRGAELETEWPVHTEAVGSGQCRLRVATRFMRLEGDLDPQVGYIELEHEPAVAAQLGKLREALALADELGLRRPPASDEWGFWNNRWEAQWGEKPDAGAPPHHRIDVHCDGNIRAYRSHNWPK
jgi:hypothetical protein